MFHGPNQTNIGWSWASHPLCHFDFETFDLKIFFPSIDLTRLLPRFAKSNIWNHPDICPSQSSNKYLIFIVHTYVHFRLPFPFRLAIIWSPTLHTFICFLNPELTRVATKILRRFLIGLVNPNKAGGDESAHTLSDGYFTIGGPKFCDFS